MLIALAILYCPGFWVIVHPRAAGFSLLGFSLLTALIALVWMGRGAAAAARLECAGRCPAAVAIFAVWANLHGGFVAGLLLIAVVVVGLAFERRWGRGQRDRRPASSPCWPPPAPWAPATVLVATPLGGELRHLPGELPQLGDLGGQLGVAPGLPVAAGDRLPGCRRRLRRLAVAGEAWIAGADPGAGRPRLPRLRGPLAAQHRLRRAGGRPRDRLAGARPAAAGSAAADRAGARRPRSGRLRPGRSRSARPETSRSSTRA